LGIHECSGATSQNGATPEILKISGSPEYRAESTPVSDSGVLSTGGLNELSTGDLNGLQAANQQMLQNPEAPAPTPATTRPPAPEQNSSKHIGEKDLLLLFVLALILAVFTFLTGGIGWLASWGMGTAASSAVSTIGSAAAGAAKKAAQIARGMGGGG
jgi:hypothetical protein